MQQHSVQIWTSEQLPECKRYTACHKVTLPSHVNVGHVGDDDDDVITMLVHASCDDNRLTKNLKDISFVI
jgi:hypothetical protein